MHSRNDKHKTIFFSFCNVLNVKNRIIRTQTVEELGEKLETNHYRQFHLKSTFSGQVETVV